MLSWSEPVSSHDSINAYHRQISLTGTDHNISKLFKVIQVEKKQLLNILIFEKICKRIIKKKKKQTTFPVKNIGHTLYASHSFFLTLITISFICSITFQYLSPLSFLFFFVFISLPFSWFAHPPQNTFYNLATFLIQFDYNPHSTIRFHYDTPYRKYLLNCKQRFRTK